MWQLRMHCNLMAARRRPSRSGLFWHKFVLRNAYALKLLFEASDENSEIAVFDSASPISHKKAIIWR